MIILHSIICISINRSVDGADTRLLSMELLVIEIPIPSNFDLYSHVPRRFNRTLRSPRRPILRTSPFISSHQHILLWGTISTHGGAVVFLSPLGSSTAKYSASGRVQESLIGVTPHVLSFFGVQEARKASPHSSRFPTCMGSLVHLAAVAGAEAFVALTTGVRFLTSVATFVHIES